MAALRPADTVYLAVGATSAQSGMTMIDGSRYVFVSSTACWVALGASPTAAKQTNGSHYVPANVPVEFFCTNGAVKLAVIQDAAGGSSTLSMAVD